MKKGILIFASVLFVLSCQKESEILPNQPEDDSIYSHQPSEGDELDFRAPVFYDVCHQLGNGNFVVRRVNQNALQNHIDHGDAVDFDGDGYFNAPNACNPTVDCDDSDPTVFQNCCSTDLLSVDLPDGTTLFVHPTDNSTAIEWGGYLTNIETLPDINFLPGALGDFNGAINTIAIVNQLGPGNYAASLCENLVAFNCDDWYLPAMGELQEMYLQLGPGGSNEMPDGTYWSSTEFNLEIGWAQVFSTNSQLLEFKNLDYRCRCVRK